MEHEITHGGERQAGASEGLVESAAERAAARERFAARLRRIWNRRRLVLRFTFAGLACSTAIAFLLPKQFSSTARLMPPDQTGSSSGMAMLAASASGTASGLGTVASGLLGLKSSGALFVGVLQSRTVRDDIISKFHLQKVYGERYLEDARRELARNSDIYEDRKSGIITIQVTDHDPERAMAVAQEYTEELNRVVNQLSTSSAHREREFLEERLKTVQRELGDAETQFSQFASQNAAIDIQTQGKAMIDAAATLQGRLIAAESELEGLRQIYTDDNVRVRSVRAQISELKSQLGRISGAAESDPPARLGMQNDLQYPSIRRLPLLGVTYADLYRRRAVQEAVFETLTREYELAKVEEVKQTPSVKVLDPASVPEKKSFPPRLLIISAGTSGAFLAGLAWLLMSAFWDETDPGDPRRVLALEVYQSAKGRLAWLSPSGLPAGVMSRKVWRRLHHRSIVREEAE